jgi:hypothetical protein
MYVHVCVYIAYCIDMQKLKILWLLWLHCISTFFVRFGIALFGNRPLEENHCGCALFSAFWSSARLGNALIVCNGQIFQDQRVTSPAVFLVRHTFSIFGGTIKVLKRHYETDRKFKLFHALWTLAGLRPHKLLSSNLKFQIKYFLSSNLLFIIWTIIMINFLFDWAPSGPE